MVAARLPTAIAHCSFQGDRVLLSPPVPHPATLRESGRTRPGKATRSARHCQIGVVWKSFSVVSEGKIRTNAGLKYCRRSAAVGPRSGRRLADGQNTARQASICRILSVSGHSASPGRTLSLRELLAQISTLIAVHSARNTKELATPSFCRALRQQFSIITRTDQPSSLANADGSTFGYEV